MCESFQHAEASSDVSSGALGKGRRTGHERGGCHYHASAAPWTWGGHAPRSLAAPARLLPPGAPVLPAQPRVTFLKCRAHAWNVPRLCRAYRKGAHFGMDEAPCCFLSPNAPVPRRPTAPCSGPARPARLRPPRHCARCPLCPMPSSLPSSLSTEPTPPRPSKPGWHLSSPLSFLTGPQNRHTPAASSHPVYGSVPAVCLAVELGGT